MKHKYRILGIAPYEGMKALMSDVAEEYPQIDLTLFVGDLEQGLEIAHSNFHGNYDVVISRGGTAKMLKENLPLPVVEIPVSMYDLLCVLKLAGASTGAGKVSMSTPAFCAICWAMISIFAQWTTGRKWRQSLQECGKATAKQSSATLSPTQSQSGWGSTPS